MTQKADENINILAFSRRRLLSQSNLSGESEEWPGDYRQATLALISGWTGIDFGQYRPDRLKPSVASVSPAMAAARSATCGAFR